MKYQPKGMGKGGIVNKSYGSYGNCNFNALPNFAGKQKAMDHQQ